MKDNIEITIKELAEKLGISKQAVRRYVEQLPSSLISMMVSIKSMLTPLLIMLQLIIIRVKKLKRKLKEIN